MKLFVFTLLTLCALVYSFPSDIEGLNTLESLEDAHAAPLAAEDSENAGEQKRVTRGFCCGGGGFGRFPRFGGGGFGGFPRYGGYGGYPGGGYGGFPGGGYGGYPRGGGGFGGASASASASASAGGFGFGK